MQSSNTKWGFTLVELIVVITIVGILSTIWFVSYSGYLTGARDSNRISQMIKLSDSLQVYWSTKSLPLPDNSVEITASGTTIAYQGEVWVDVLETIDYTNGGTDPKDDSYYSYMLTKDRKSMQLMAMMEEERTISLNNRLTLESYAINYEDRFPKVYGRKLWILTQLDTNTPIQELSQYQSVPFDLVTETSQFVSHISDTEKITWTGASLKWSIHNANCNRIKQLWGSRWSWYYEINISGLALEAYCEMEFAWWGWTLQLRSYSWSTNDFSVAHGSVRDDTASYAAEISSTDAISSWSWLSWTIKRIMLWGTYTSWKDMDVMIRRIQTIDYDNLTLSNSCEDIIWNSWVSSDCSNLWDLEPDGFVSPWTNINGKQWMKFIKEISE